MHARAGCPAADAPAVRALPAAQLYVAGPDDDLEAIKEEVMEDMTDIFSSVDKTGENLRNLNKFQDIWRCGEGVEIQRKRRAGEEGGHGRRLLLGGQDRVRRKERKTTAFLPGVRAASYAHTCMPTHMYVAPACRRGRVRAGLHAGVAGGAAGVP